MELSGIENDKTELTPCLVLVIHNTAILGKTGSSGTFHPMNKLNNKTINQNSNEHITVYMLIVLSTVPTSIKDTCEHFTFMMTNIPKSIQSVSSK